MAPSEAAGAGSTAPAFRPIDCLDLELSEPWPELPTDGTRDLQVLVRLHGEPLGGVTVADLPAGDPADLLAERIAAAYARQIAAHLRADGLPVEGTTVDGRGDWALLSAACRASDVSTCQRRLEPGTPAPLVSVVVCTIGTEKRLPDSLRALLAQDYEPYEVVVVDNAPDNPTTRTLVEQLADPRLRYVPETRRGLSVARNTGLAAARGELVAYTDDDAIADRGWVRTVAAVFAEDPRVACVTGLVLPAEAATQAQAWFEEFGGFDRGYQRLVWRLPRLTGPTDALGPAGDGGPVFPYSAGYYGSGNNMAFRRDVLVAMGGFDVALGAGSLAKGGEDLDAYLTVLLGGGVLVYEPRAMVRHYHRSDYDALRTQMKNYGIGLTAMLAKRVLTSPRELGTIAARVPAGVKRLLDPGSTKNEKKGAQYPRELTRLELFGFVAGPALYVRARVDARRRGLRPDRATAGAAA